MWLSSAWQQELFTCFASRRLLPNTHTSAHSLHAVGAPISCTVILSNDGNVGLSAFAFVVGTTGYTLECTDSSALGAGSTRNCTLNTSVDQVSNDVLAEQISWHGPVCKQAQQAASLNGIHHLGFAANLNMPAG